jgi:hypothetical protein
MAGDVLHPAKMALTLNDSRQRPWPGGQRPDYCHCRLEGECQCVLVFVTPTSSPVMTSSRKRRRHVRFVDSRALDESLVVDDVSGLGPSSGNWWESPPASLSSSKWEVLTLPSSSLLSSRSEDDEVDNEPVPRFDSSRQMALADDNDLLAEQHLGQLCLLLNNSSTCSSVSDLAEASLNTSARSTDSLNNIHHQNGFVNGHTEIDQVQGCNGHHDQQLLANGATHHHVEKDKPVLPLQHETDVDTILQQQYQPAAAAGVPVLNNSDARPVRTSSPTVLRSRNTTSIRTKSSRRNKPSTGFLETNLDDLMLGDNCNGGLSNGNHGQNGAVTNEIRYRGANHCTGILLFYTTIIAWGCSLKKVKVNIRVINEVGYRAE